LLDTWESIATPTALHFSEVSEESMQTEKPEMDGKPLFRLETITEESDLVELKF
jgi:hypothetical protein